MVGRFERKEIVMTLYNVIRTLQKIALQQPNVRSTGDGDIYNWMNGNDGQKYGCFFITQGTHSGSLDEDRYNLTLFYVDRLDDTLEENRLSIQSIGRECLDNIIRTFVEEYELDYPDVNYTPFTQKFIDETAGMYATLTITIEKGICEEYYGE